MKLYRLIPKRLWITLLVLLPLISITAMAVHRYFLASGRFSPSWRDGDWFYFCIGVAVWLVWWWKLPRPDWFYVIAHEFTHALVTWLCGGWVRNMRIGRSSGHVVITKSNCWISLSPYFVPLYALLWCGIWQVAEHFGSGLFVAPVFWTGLGAALAFHLTYTVKAIRVGQSDLKKEGVLFSMGLILMGNAVWLIALLASFSGHHDWTHFFAAWSDVASRLLTAVMSIDPK